VETAERGIQLTEGCAVSFLRSELQGRQIILGKAIQRIFISTTKPTTTIQPSMLFEKLSEELLGGGFRRGMSGAPDLVPVPLKPDPVGRTALVDCCHNQELRLEQHQEQIAGSDPVAEFVACHVVSAVILAQPVAVLVPQYLLATDTLDLSDPVAIGIA